MQALKLSKKYPEFKQDEIFDLVNKFKYVQISLWKPSIRSSSLHLRRWALFPLNWNDLWSSSYESSFRTYTSSGADSRQIDVDDKGSLDKAAVIAALGQSGDADYDSVSTLHLTLDYPEGKEYPGSEQEWVGGAGWMVKDK